MNLFRKLIVPLLVFVLLSTGIAFLLNHQKVANAEQNSLLAQQCTGTAPAHAMLVMDRSGSMADKIGNSGATKLSKAKEAAKLFVDKLKNNNVKTKIGMVKFSDSANLDKPFGTDWTGIKTSIDALKANGETCAACGLKKAKDEITSKHESGVKDVVIFLTDGKANNTLAGKRDATAAKEEAVQQANQLRQQGVIIYSIGLGPEVQPDFLKQVAGDDSRYFSSPTTDQLNQIYNDIAKLIGGGSISGTVFNDANNNGIKDSGEVGLSGWTVNLSGDATASTTSESNGTYKFEGLCDGNYNVSETSQDGWTQTKPTNPSNYPVTINSNNSTITDKDFGNFQKPVCDRGANGEENGTCNACQAAANSCGPNNGTQSCSFTTHHTGVPCTPVNRDRQCTINMCSAGSHCDQGTTPYQCKPDPSPSPGQVQLSFVLGLDGTGATGDFSNRNQTFGTDNPNYQVTHAQACLYTNGQNDNNFCNHPYALDLNYNGSTKLWIGSLNISEPPGTYSIKVRAQKYLIRKIGPDMTPAKQTWTLVAGNNQIGTADSQAAHSNLMVGDIDGGDFGDNTLTSVDYNIIRDCLDTHIFTSITPGHCSDTVKSAKADLNANGKVDQDDLNYFIRERATGDGGLPGAEPTPTPSTSPTITPSPSQSSTPTPAPSSTPVGQKLSKLTCPSSISVTKNNKEVSVHLTNNSGNVNLDDHTVTFASSISNLIINPTSGKTGANGNAKTNIKFPQSFSGQGNGTLTASFAGGNSYAASTCNVNLTWNIN